MTLIFLTLGAALVLGAIIKLVIWLCRRFGPSQDVFLSGDEWTAKKAAEYWSERNWR
jgi:hypothetical protein